MQLESVFQPAADKISNSVLRTEEFSQGFCFVLSVGWGTSATCSFFKNLLTVRQNPSSEGS